MATADPLFYSSDLVGNRINPNEGNRETEQNLNGEKKRRPHMGYRSADETKEPKTNTTTTMTTIDDQTTTLTTTVEDSTSTDQTEMSSYIFDVSEYDVTDDDDSTTFIPSTSSNNTTSIPDTSVVKTSINVDAPEMGIERPEVGPTSEMDIDDHHDYGSGMTTKYEFDENEKANVTTPEYELDDEENETTSEYELELEGKGNKTISEYELDLGGNKTTAEYENDDEEKETTTEMKNMVQGFVVGTSDHLTDDSISDELFGNKNLDSTNSAEEMFPFQSQENATETSTENVPDSEEKNDESSKNEFESEPLEPSSDEDSIMSDILPTEKLQIVTSLNMTKSINLTLTEDEVNEIEVLLGEVESIESLTQNNTEYFSSSGFQFKENPNMFAAIAFVIHFMR